MYINHACFHPLKIWQFHVFLVLRNSCQLIKPWQSMTKLSHSTGEHHKCLFMWSRDYIHSGWKLTQPHWGAVKEMKEHPDGTSKQPTSLEGMGGVRSLVMQLYWYVTWTFLRPHPYYRYMFLLQRPHSPADKSYTGMFSKFGWGQTLQTENRMCPLFCFELMI